MRVNRTDVHRLADEQQRTAEFSKYDEWQIKQENAPSIERVGNTTGQEFNLSAGHVDKKSGNVSKRLPTSGMSLAMTMVTIVTAVVIPVNIYTLKCTLRTEQVGVDYFRGNILAKNTNGVRLTTVLRDESGEIIEQTALEQNGDIAFEWLNPESKYILSVEDEKGKAYLSYAFETEPYVTLSYLEDGQSAQLILHPTLSVAHDARFFLYDAEGKSFSDNVQMGEWNPDGGNGFDSATDSVTDMEIEYYLRLDGLYIGEYALQFIQYLPDGNERIYEKILSLGDLVPLQYMLEVDANAGQVALQYTAGDIGPYETFLAELYQNGEYYTAVDVTQFTDTTLTFPISSDWASGNYTLYLIGVTGGAMYNEIWKGEMNL